jgi:hypothetical protein
MSHSLLRTAAAVGTAVAIAASASSLASAAPIGSGQLALKSAAPGAVIDVNHRRHHHPNFGAAAAAGIFGLALGATLASPYWGPHYGPVYVGPPAPPPPRRCWYQTGPYRGQGYWDWC